MSVFLSLQTPESPFTQSTGQKERPNLSLDLKSIDLRGDCHKSTPGPTTASILKKIETVEPDLKEIFPHINDNHAHTSGTDQLDTHVSPSESTAVSNVSIDNVFDEYFKNASSQRLHLNVPPSVANKDQSLETPAIKLVSPSKGPNLLNAKTLTCDPSSVNNSNNCGDITEEVTPNNNNNNNHALPSRKRGRPPKAVTKSSAHESDSCDNDSESKKLRDRERNRQAAINYRRNQKDWVREISARMRLLEDKNVTLEVSRFFLLFIIRCGILIHRVIYAHILCRLNLSPHRGKFNISRVKLISLLNQVTKALNSSTNVSCLQ